MSSPFTSSGAPRRFRDIRPGSNFVPVVVTDEGSQLLRAVITVQPRNAKAVRVETLIFKSGQ